MLSGLQPDATDDLRAIDRIRSSDPSGLEQLYDAHATMVYSLALRIVRDVGDAEDVTQETFAQVWTRAAAYDPGRGPVAAWLLIIARSRALDRLRRNRTALKPGPGVDGLNEIPGAGPSVEWIVATDEQARAAQQALAELPSTERTVIELAYYEGLTQSEIATRTASPLGTVKTRIRTALRRLRTALTTTSSPEREP
ncbi:MAG: sigma-70 family RNA polymerase sigma factor [Acidobacteria bacterium]|nr:sigma-70 family RNA polymerase sigma factor [Acidobacteriota bacterium]